MQDKSKSKGDPSQQRGSGNQNFISDKSSLQSDDMGGGSAGRIEDNESFTRGNDHDSSSRKQHDHATKRNRSSDDY